MLTTLETAVSVAMKVALKYHTKPNQHPIYTVHPYKPATVVVVTVKVISIESAHCFRYLVPTMTIASENAHQAPPI